MYLDKNVVVWVVLKYRTDQDMCQVLICLIHDLVNDRLRKNLKTMSQYSLIFQNSQDYCNELQAQCKNSHCRHQLDIFNITIKWISKIKKYSIYFFL